MVLLSQNVIPEFVMVSAFILTMEGLKKIKREQRKVFH